MQINGAVALVTGGNRGFGEKFVQALLDGGAAKVYAAARNPASVTVPGAVPITLDITDPESVRAAAERAGDVTLLINNAGASNRVDLLTSDMDVVRHEFETHVFGTLAVSRAFAPILARNGGGAILNVLSALSWFTTPGSAVYSAAKSAEWSLTNATRLALHDQGTLVTGLHVGYMDTDMTAGIDAPKSDPAKIARIALDGVEAGLYEVLADDTSRQVKAGLAADPSALYAELATR